MPSGKQKLGLSPKPIAPVGLLAGFKFFSAVFGLAVSLILGLLFWRLWPKKAEEINTIIGSRFGQSLLVGFIALVIFPMIVLLLLVSLIGIPLLFILVPFFLFLLWFSKILTAFYLGKRILVNQTMFWSLLLGLLIYYFFKLVPFVGLLAALIFITAGLGALFLSFQTSKK